MPFALEPVSETAAVVVAAVAAEGGGASIAAASNSVGPAGLNFLDLLTVMMWRILPAQVLRY